jgi:FMN phosphatase YigB (HAD superfamily)
MAKHLLFDFGAVLIPIDQHKSYEAFEALGAKEELADQVETFAKMERGELSEDAFLGALQPYFLRTKIFKKDLATAWNALCYAPIPSENIDLLKRLKRDYSLYLLSNTNSLHIQKIKKLSGRFSYAQFMKQFAMVFYSHEMGHRKPERTFYDKVLGDANLKAEDCFFIDDKKENIQMAADLGMETWHFNPEMDSILDLAKKLK